MELIMKVNDFLHCDTYHGHIQNTHPRHTQLDTHNKTHTQDTHTRHTT